MRRTRGKSGEGVTDVSQKLSDQIYDAHRMLRDKPRLCACTRYIEREFGCSYNRAALIISVLEDAKVLGEADHGGFRRWLMEPDAGVVAIERAI